MTPAEWQRVKSVFEQARALPDDDREAFLAEHCGDEVDIRREVDSLLANDRPYDDFLAAPALGTDFNVAQWPDHLPPALGTSRVGPYEIIRLIGAGGMGVVYEAVGGEPPATVALKILRHAGPGEGQLVRRFEREAESLGRLRHPGIAAVRNADTTADGHHYLAMELVRGTELDAYVRSLGLGIAERLKLFVKVCDAVHYAHQRGVIHRDLKPSNIFVDDGGQPKILDFGLARITDGDVAVTTLVTEIGKVMGTLPYMSPEQAKADPNEIDLRSDVYSLGIVLYELLTDRLPYELTPGALPEAVRVICEQAPRRPSLVRSLLRGDLETIMLTAIEKEPPRRYQSVAALRDDLQRYLDGQAIVARPPSAAEQVRRLVLRYKLAAGLLALLFVTALAFGIVSTVQALRLGRANATVLAQTEDQGQLLYCSRINHAQLLREDGNLGRMNAVLDACDPRRRGWEWAWLRYGLDRSDRTFTVLDHVVRAFSSAADPVTLVAGGADHELDVIDGLTGETLHTLVGTGRPLPAVAVSADGQLAATGDDAGTVTVWSLLDGRDLRRIDVFDGVVQALCFTYDGREIIAVGGLPADPLADLDRFTRARPTVSVIDRTRGDVRLELPMTDRVTSIAVDDDRRRLVTVTDGGTIGTWNMDDGRPLATIEQGTGAMAVAVTPAGEIVTGNLDKTVRIWDPETTTLLGRFDGHERGVGAVAVSPDGALVVSADGGGTVMLRETGTGAVVFSQLAHDEVHCTVGFSADGAWFYSCSRDGTAKRWSTNRSVETLTTIAEVPAVLALRADGAQLVTGLADGRVLLHDVEGGRRTAIGSTAPLPPRAVAVTPGGTYVAAATDDRTIRLLSPGAPAIIVSPSGSSTISAVRALAFAPDGQTLYAGAADGAVTPFDVETARQRPSFIGHTGPVECIAISPDGRWLASGASDETVRVWDLRRPAPVGLLTDHSGPVRALAFSPDGTRLASASQDRSVIVWELQTMQSVRTLVGHEGSARSVSFSPDGRRLATGSQDGTIKLWHLEQGVELLSLRWPEHMVADARYSSDGSTIYAAYLDGFPCAWRAGAPAD